MKTNRPEIWPIFKMVLSLVKLGERKLFNVWNALQLRKKDKEQACQKLKRNSSFSIKLALGATTVAKAI